MDAAAVMRRSGQLFRLLIRRGSFPLPKIVLAAIWFFVLWWGERSTFRNSVESCRWEKWEDWPADATPHHVVLLTDPQIVDPHTYPGRPWPLSSFTIAHTDQYLRRSYQSLTQTLDPDSILFLGDLFDGGREWWTGRGERPADKTWRKYGTDYWLGEYDRWVKIFMSDAQMRRTGDHPRGDRKIIASLPGNHDLGISSGVRPDVRDRFLTFFGESNRVDVIGNHSFVSVDTVSLTAKQLEGEEKERYRNVWEPAHAFLKKARNKKAQVLERYLRGKFGLPENPRLDHSVYDIDSPEATKQQSNAPEGIHADVPTVLLTHVPLFREEGTQCGPLREKYPPSVTKSDGGPVKDIRNAISLHAGYQYQNVLHPDITKELVEKVGNVAHVFSGDDHDYCEIVHKGYTSNGGGIREITVKSMSWAMGVRKPGFLLVSLWNPIDGKGEPITQKSAAGGKTIQTHLCLLPDALGTFLRYGELFALTVLVLAVAAVRGSRAAADARTDVPLLPLSNKSRNGSATNLSGGGGSASSSFSDPSALGLASRNGKRASGSPGNGHGNGYAYAIPVDHVEPDPVYSPLKGKFAGRSSFLAGALGSEKNSRRQLLVAEFASSLLQVGAVGLLWYYWLTKSF